jgi:hypothetical protein
MCTYAGFQETEQQVIRILELMVNSKLSKVLFGSRNVRQMVIVMVYTRLPAVTSLNRPVSIFSVVSNYGWTKTNMI